MHASRFIRPGIHHPTQTARVVPSAWTATPGGPPIATAPVALQVAVRCARGHSAAIAWRVPRPSTDPVRYCSEALPAGKELPDGGQGGEYRAAVPIFEVPNANQVELTGMRVLAQLSPAGAQGWAGAAPRVDIDVFTDQNPTLTGAIFTEIAKLNLALWVAGGGLSVEGDTCRHSSACWHKVSKMFLDANNGIVVGRHSAADRQQATPRTGMRKTAGSCT